MIVESGVNPPRKRPIVPRTIRTNPARRRRVAIINTMPAVVEKRRAFEGAIRNLAGSEKSKFVSFSI
jgi:hypothetical protein